LYELEKPFYNLPYLHARKKGEGWKVSLRLDARTVFSDLRKSNREVDLIKKATLSSDL